MQINGYVAVFIYAYSMNILKLIMGILNLGHIETASSPSFRVDLLLFRMHIH